MSETATPADQWSDGTPRWDDTEAAQDDAPAPESEVDREQEPDESTEVEHEPGESDIRVLRERAKTFDEAQAAMPALQRENALLRSGIDLESPLGKYFVESYKGDQTDVEGLRAKAAELGIPFKGQPAP